MAKKHNSMDVLAHAILSSFEPLIHALDGQVDDTGVIQVLPDAADTGHERPSQRDNGMRFLIGGICQSIWRQNHGVITDKKGNVYDNSKQRLARSEKDRAAIAEKLINNELDTDDLKAIHWFKVNEARYHAQEDLLLAFSQVYNIIFGEPWKPYGDEAKADVKTKRVLTKEEQEAALKLLGIAVNREASRAVEIDEATPKRGIRSRPTLG